MLTPNTIARSGLHIVRGERFNGFSHLLGLLLSLAAGALLVDEAVMKGDAAASVGAAVFSLASVLLYAASTLYHFTQGAAKAIWRRADHCAIYLMIAGTYTPFGLLTWNGPRAAVAIGAIWGLAAVGIVRELRAGPGAPPSLLFYLGLGWLTVLATFPLAAALMVWSLRGSSPARAAIPSAPSSTATAGIGVTRTAPGISSCSQAPPVTTARSSWAVQ